MDWNAKPSDTVIAQTVAGLKQRGLEALVVEGRAAALSKLKELIPAGASVMAGSSTTLDEIGFTDYLKSAQHPYKNLKEAIVAEKDQAQQARLRAQASLADYFLGSVQAVTHDGVVLSCDASGSRTGPYSFGPGKVILVAGVNKLVPTAEDGLRRIREHCVPLEDQRMKKAGFPGTTLARILITEHELFRVRTTLILVKEKLGF
ncbi:MAG: lactate utilization protein [Chloroflexi bacterium]|nr:lactate utilization protein [Chloroflexota bacterium]